MYYGMAGPVYGSPAHSDKMARETRRSGHYEKRTIFEIIDVGSKENPQWVWWDKSYDEWVEDDPGKAGEPLLSAGIGLPIYYAFGEAMTALGLTSIAYHANDKRSTKQNYLYVIKAYKAPSGMNVDNWSVYETIKYFTYRKGGYD
jgi:hypothetical protein